MADEEMKLPIAPLSMRILTGALLSLPSYTRGHLLILLDSLTLLSLISPRETSSDDACPSSPVRVWLRRGLVLGAGLCLACSSLSAWGLREMCLFPMAHDLFLRIL